MSFDHPNGIPAASSSLADTPGSPPALAKKLGWGALLVLGIGNILGAGVYVMTGTAAANYAGPAVVLSFVMAGIACAMVGLCYAELASRFPQSGSAYSYCRASFGRRTSWVLGWLLLLEYNLSASILAVGFAGYLGSLLQNVGVTLAPWLSSPVLDSAMYHGHSVLTLGHGVNLVAAAAALAAGAILALGISKSITINAILVVIKVVVLLIFVGIGLSAVVPGNWHPFVPANEGGFSYGWEGVCRAASMLFFAYLGFETVSTAAAETRHPRRDVPIGIFGSLAICTVLYIAAAAVVTGVVPFRELGVPDPIAVAVDRMGRPGMAVVVKLGALTGLASVLLANAYGQSRICFAIASDRLLPELFCRRHPRSGSLWLSNLLLGAIAAVSAALLPISLLGDLVCLGVTSCFCVVAITLMRVRGRETCPAEGFRVPLGGIRMKGLWLGFVPVAAVVLSAAMVAPVLIDLVSRALHGDMLPAAMLSAYLCLGALVYLCYGRRQSVPTRVELF